MSANARTTAATTSATAMWPIDLSEIILPIFSIFRNWTETLQGPVVWIIIVRFSQWCVISTIRNIACSTMQHDRQCQSLSAVTWRASRTWGVRVLYELTVAMATSHHQQRWPVLRWRTSSSIICILETRSRTLPSTSAKTSGGVLDRHEHGISYKKQLLLPRDTSRDC